MLQDAQDGDVTMPDQNDNIGETTLDLAATRLDNERKSLIRMLQLAGWAPSQTGLTFRIGTGKTSKDNPDGLETLELRMAEDLTLARFFIGSALVAYVHLEPGDPHKNEWRITKAAGAMDHGLVRPEPDPLPDDFNPIQVINYLYERYATRLGTIKTNHLYEVRTESWDGLCAAQGDNLLAEIYVPSYHRPASGEIAGMYHRRIERNGEWNERSPIQYEPGSEAGKEALARARRLGVDFPAAMPTDQMGIRQVVKKAKMGF